MQPTIKVLAVRSCMMEAEYCSITGSLTEEEIAEIMYDNDPLTWTVEINDEAFDVSRSIGECEVMLELLCAHGWSQQQVRMFLSSIEKAIVHDREIIETLLERAYSRTLHYFLTHDEKVIREAAKEFAHHVGAITDGQ